MAQSQTSGSSIRPRAEVIATAAPVLSTATIALCAAAGVCLVLVIAFATHLYRKRRRPSASTQSLKEQIGEPVLKAAPQHAVAGPSILLKSPTIFGRATAPQKQATRSGKRESSSDITEEKSEAISLSKLPKAKAIVTAGPAPLRPPRAVVNRTPVPQTQVAGPSSDRTPSRPSRAAVPSMLIRSLGDLPASHPTASSSGQGASPSSTLRAPEAEAIDEDDVSLTPILNFEFPFSDEGHSEIKPSDIALEDQLDFEIERTRWMSSALSTAYEGRKSLSASRAPSRTSMASSPTRPPPLELPPVRDRAMSNAAGSDSASSAGPTDSIYTGAASNPALISGPLSSKSSKAFTAIAMPGLPPIDFSDDGVLPTSSFRPLSLGLSFGKSSSQMSLGAAVFGNMSTLWGADRSDAGDSASDLESGRSGSLSMSRDWSSGGSSHASSNTSFTSEAANISIGKATVVPAASLPPLPPFPRHLTKPAEPSRSLSSPTSPTKETASGAPVTAPPRPSRAIATTTTQAAGKPVSGIAFPAQAQSAPAPALPSAVAIAAIPTKAPLPPVPSMPTQLRKRASTFGSSGELSAMLRKDAMAAANKAPILHAEAPVIGSLRVNAARVNASAISLPMAMSEAKQSLLLQNQPVLPAVPFMSQYHRAVFPDPPSQLGRRSLDEQGMSPLQLQLAAFGTPGSTGSPRPRFSESLKMRLSLSRKSLPGSPALGSKESSPRLPQLEHFPQPTTSLPFPGQPDAASSAAPSPTRSGFFRTRKSLSRPSTAEDKRMRRSPLAGGDAQLPRSRPGTGDDDGSSSSITTATVTRPITASSDKMASDFASPIMQPGKWAQSVPQIRSDETMRSPTRPELRRIDLQGLNDPMSLSSSAPSTAATSPLEEIEARLSMHIDADVVRRAAPDTATQASFDCENVATAVAGDEDRAGIHSRSVSEVSQATVQSSVRLSVASTSISAGGADTVSIMSSCATDSIAGEHDRLSPASRRAKLLESVRQNIAQDLAKDREATTKALSNNALDQMSATISDEPNNFGLGLYSAEPEELDEDEDLATGPGRLQHRGLMMARSGQRRPAALHLVEKHAKLEGMDAIAPLTPPYTPIHSHMLPTAGGGGGVAQPQSGRRKLELVSSMSAKSTVVPFGRSRSNVDIATSNREATLASLKSMGTRLSPLTGSPSTPSLPTFASNSGNDATDTPLLHAGYGTSSAKLRPLSLASSSTVVGIGGVASASDAGTPVLRKLELAERAAFSPALNSGSALSSPNPSYAMGRVSMDRTSRRFSRAGAPAANRGGVLPTVNSSGALQTGRAYHAADFTASSSKDSMLSSSNNSFASFSNHSHSSTSHYVYAATSPAPSPAKSAYKSLYGAAAAIRPPSLVATRAAPQPPTSMAVEEAARRSNDDEVLADVLNHVDLASAIGI